MPARPKFKSEMTQRRIVKAEPCVLIRTELLGMLRVLFNNAFDIIAGNLAYNRMW